MVRGWVKFGLRDRNGKLVAEGLEPALKRNGVIGNKKVRQFKAYMVARRADYLYDQQFQGKRELRKGVQDAFGGQLGVTWEQAQGHDRAL